MVTQKRLKELFIYRDGGLYWREGSARRQTERPVGYIDRRSGYLSMKVDNTTQYVHRMIFLYHHGHLPDIIDHKDGVPLHNNIENLRECTVSQNALNRKVQINSTTRKTGISFNRGRNKYEAYVHIDGKKKHLGICNTIQEAEKLRREAAKKYYGEFYSERE